MKNNFDDEIKNIVAKMHEIEQNSIPQNEALRERYELSEGFYKKMKRLVKKVDRSRKVVSAVRYAAATAAVIAIVCCVSQPGIVTKACEALIRQMSDHMNFRFKADVGNVVIPEYEAGYVPEGYVLEKSDYDELGGLLVYWKEKDMLIILYGGADGSLNVDNEETMYKIIKLRNGTEIHYLKSESGEKDNSMTWLSKDETIVFSISAPLPEEELLKIQKNIRKKKAK